MAKKEGEITEEQFGSLVKAAFEAIPDPCPHALEHRIMVGKDLCSECSNK